MQNRFSIIFSNSVENQTACMPTPANIVSPRNVRMKLEKKNLLLPRQFWRVGDSEKSANLNIASIPAALATRSVMAAIVKRIRPEKVRRWSKAHCVPRRTAPAEMATSHLTVSRYHSSCFDSLRG